MDMRQAMTRLDQLTRHYDDRSAREAFEVVRARVVELENAVRRAVMHLEADGRPKTADMIRDSASDKGA
jgi:hypothetical protein